jgi:hypothetical protein
VTVYRFRRPGQQGPMFGVPERAAVTVSPTDFRGEFKPTVFPQPRTTEKSKTGEMAIFLHDGDIIDEILAQFLRAKGYGENVSPVGACPLDGASDCRLGGAGWPDTPVTVTGAGSPLELADAHRIVAAERAGQDWRATAIAHVPGGRPQSYDRVFKGERPTPTMPEPQALRAPRFVRDWFHSEVVAGRIVVAEKLPEPAVRRQLRESAGLSRPQAAELIGGISAEALRLWELGEREPEGENKERYVEMLRQWASPQQPEPEAAPMDGGSPYVGMREAAEAARADHGVFNADDYEKAKQRAAAARRDRPHIRTMTDAQAERERLARQLGL